MTAAHTQSTYPVPRPMFYPHLASRICISRATRHADDGPAFRHRVRHRRARYVRLIEGVRAPSSVALVSHRNGFGFGLVF